MMIEMQATIKSLAEENFRIKSQLRQQQGLAMDLCTRQLRVRVPGDGTLTCRTRLDPETLKPSISLAISVVLGTSIDQNSVVNCCC